MAGEGRAGNEDVIFVTGVEEEARDGDSFEDVGKAFNVRADEGEWKIEGKVFAIAEYGFEEDIECYVPCLGAGSRSRW